MQLVVMVLAAPWAYPVALAFASLARYTMLRSYLHTAAKHGIGFLAALKSVCAGSPWLPELPSTS